jgi:Fe2+ transport system protein B
VADATALARALYLTIEILEIGHPVVIALNMTDEARRDGIDIDVERLEALTGARVIPTVASKGMGTDALRAALAAAIERSEVPRMPDVARSSALQADLAELEGLILSERVMDRPQEARVWAQWLLLSLEHDWRRPDEHPRRSDRRPPRARAAPRPAATSISRSSHTGAPRGSVVARSAVSRSIRRS